MKIEIIAVGSELLTPFFLDTNSLYLSERLNDLGQDVSFKTIVGDNREDLLFCIRKALAFANFLLVMGGLGPTEDDITREVMAEALHRKLIFHEEILQKIEARFKRRGINMPATNKKQAYVIKGAEIFENKNGTAPGQWLVQGRTRIVLLPGPPHELKPMFEEFVWPKLHELELGHMARKTLKTTGLTESEVESLIHDLYPKDRDDLRLTVLASPGQIELHLTAFSPLSARDSEAKIEAFARPILDRLGDNVFSTSGEELEEVVGALLRDRKKTLATAESCTGGLLANRLTNISGSSDYFMEGLITYSDQAKNLRLDVPLALIQSYGAVSPEVAQAMAVGVRRKAKASFGLAVTGIAGPTGGTPEKPVGLVYAALAQEHGADVEKNIFLGKREQIKFQSSQKALDMLRRYLLKGNLR
jgi:nicotinamide-nucleotide amidase